MGGAASIANYVEDTINEKCNEIVDIQAKKSANAITIAGNTTLSSVRKDIPSSSSSRKSSHAVNLQKKTLLVENSLSGKLIISTYSHDSHL
jgi:hypothetical protein